jgi:hypothetical protein
MALLLCRHFDSKVRKYKTHFENTKNSAHSDVCAMVLISGLDNNIYTEHYPGFRCLERSQRCVGYPCEQCSRKKHAARPPTTGFGLTFSLSFLEIKLTLGSTVLC